MEPRGKIARAIFTTREFTAAAAFGVPIDAKTECAEGIADAVIAALGLREEYERGWVTAFTDGTAIEYEDRRRWVTEWEEAE